MLRDNALELKLKLLNRVHKNPPPGVSPLAQAWWPKAFVDLDESQAFEQVSKRTKNPLIESMAVGVSKESNANCRLEVRIQATGKVGSAYREAAMQSIPRKAQAEVNVRHIGRIRARRRPPPIELATYKRYSRPLCCGFSVGHYTTTVGSIGAFVLDHYGQASILSNNHVLAEVNQGQPGDPIVQPGPMDTDYQLRAKHLIARLGAVRSINSIVPNKIDAAVAVLIDEMEYYPGWYPEVGMLQGACDVQESTQRVVKVGRTSGLTRGRITSTDLDNLVVDMGYFLARFDDQIEIEGIDEAFDLGGDSGAMIIDEDLYGVGLLFSGSEAEQRTYANPLVRILSMLDLQLDLL